MAIIKGAALANANENFAIVDSHNSHGGFKNHVASLSAFTSFSDLYVDVPNGTADWTGGDAWGLYKPWATMIYVEDVNPLIEVTDTTNLELGVDYFDISTDGSGVYYGPSGDTPVPGFLVYNGNSGADDENWNGNYVKEFTVTTVDGVNQASPTYWVDIKTIVTDTTLSGGSDVVITDNTVVDVDALSDFILGSVTENVVNEDYTVNFGTGADILSLIDSQEVFNAGVIIAEEVIIDGDPKIRLKTNFTSTSGHVNGFTIGDSLGGTALDATGLNSSGSLNVYGNVLFSSHTSQQTGQELVLGGNLTVEIPSLFSKTVTLSKPQGIIASGITQYTSETGDTASTSTNVVVKNSNNVLSTRGLNAIAFTGIVDGTYLDSIARSYFGGASNDFTDDLIVVTNTTGVVDIAVAASPKLATSGSGGTAAALTLGPAAVTENTDSGADDTRLIVRGSADIVGDLVVQGSLTTTSSEDVTFEDSTLSLNFLRDTDGSPSVSGAPTSGNAGLEAWYGYDTAGNENQFEYSRPYIRYEYDAGYGKWYLANSFTDPGGGDAYTANSGYILTSLDVAVAESTTPTTGLTDYHDPVIADNTVGHTATPYGLLTPIVSTDATGADNDSNEVSRHFGRVAKVTCTADANNEFSIKHNLNSQEIFVVAKIVSLAGDTGISIPAGSMVQPKYLPTSANIVSAKVLGANTGDVILFFVFG